MIPYDSTGNPHVIRPAYAEPPKLPIALYRVQGFSVALENRPEGIIATVVDVPGVTAVADTRSEGAESDRRAARAVVETGGVR